MKAFLLFSVLILHMAAYSQDTTKLRQIDAVVNQINNANFKIQRDTIKNEQPQYGFFMKKYLTTVTDGRELKKYVNNVHATTKENGKTTEMITTNTFYFDLHKLIKVEESGTNGEQNIAMQFYYADDKPIYSTEKSDKGKERAAFLITVAKSMLEKMAGK